MWHPANSLIREKVLELLCAQALQENNVPWVDHGIEVLYRFAAFDPFERSHYFGCAHLFLAGLELPRCSSRKVL